MSAAVAARDAAYPPVVSFRREVLGGRRFTSEEIPQWIFDHLDPTYSDVVPGNPRFSLRYLQRDGDPVHPVTVDVKEANEPLARLGGVIGALVELCGWTEDLALEFILTNRAPLIEITAEPRRRRLCPPSASPEIVLPVPLWATDEEVAIAWRDARNETFDALGIRRLGPKSEKLAYLAAFLWPRLNSTGKPVGGWHSVLEDWNLCCTDTGRNKWQYEDQRGNWNKPRQRFVSDFRRFERAVMRIPND